MTVAAAVEAVAMGGVLPLLAGIGLQPVRAAKERSLVRRSWLSPAVMSSVEAVSRPTPCSATRSSAAAVVMRRRRVSTCLRRSSRD